ncbi:TPR-like protein [Pholiota conissans]|uniref:TPR-like protein n=1 Tax=Pholiota conissans TaxID=109636 RepID=A0A9P5YX18_9AGAR|nr:TPR-like protein [Pholiota conissans]
MYAHSSINTPAMQTTYPNIENSVDASGSLADTVFALVKDVGETLTYIPIAKIFGGLILQIIKIRDEIKQNKQKCRELIDKVLGISKSVYEFLAEMKRLEEKAKLERLEGHLQKFQRTLSVVLEALEKHCERNFLKKLVNRDLEELNALDRQVDQLDRSLSRELLIDIKLEQVSGASPSQAYNIVPAQWRPKYSLDHVLPPKPELMVERDAQVDLALKVLLETDPSRIAILGGGGLGKTTLSRTLVHHPKILERYQLRYFLSCESILTAEDLLLSFRSMLRIEANTPTSLVIPAARHTLQFLPTLLCLDNFETPWEPPSNRDKVEDVLEAIADIPNLSLIITLRGEARPSKVVWSSPLLPPLSTLSLDGSKHVLQNIAEDHIVDEDTLKIVQAMEGIPLAVTLVSNLLRDGESSQSLWRRWSANHTHVLNTGGKGRHSNLERSIEMSIFSPRVQENSEDSRLMLAVLALLPDGVPADVKSLDNLQGHLNSYPHTITDHLQRLWASIIRQPERQYPRINDIHTAIRTLQAVSLVTVGNPVPRLRMLSPVRLFCQKALAKEITLILAQMTAYYTHLITIDDGIDLDNYDYDLPIIRVEIKNMTAIFQQALASTSSSGQDLTRLVNAILDLSRWWTFIGYHLRETLEITCSTVQRMRKNSRLYGQCLMALADACSIEGDYSEAQKVFKDAVKCFKSVRDSTEEVDALVRLSHALIDGGRLSDAYKVSNTGLELCIRKKDIVGEAFIWHTFGKLALQQQNWTLGESYTMSALATYENHNLFGPQAEANEILSCIRRNQGKFDEAEKFALASLEAGKKLKFPTFVALALCELGLVYHNSRNKITKAKPIFEKALKISKIHNYINIQIPIAQYLGAVYIFMDQFSEAVTLLTTYTARIKSGLRNQVALFRLLGIVYMSWGNPEKAKLYFDEEFILAQKLDLSTDLDLRWKATSYSDLGWYYLKAGKLDDAEKALASSGELGHWSAVEMRRQWVLGNIHLKKGQLDNAERSFNLAMVDARKAYHSFHQGIVLRSLASLHVKRGQLDLAVEKLHEALEIHRQVEWRFQQAVDLKRLGEAYISMGKIVEAEAAFKEEAELMDIVREARGIPNP